MDNQIWSWALTLVGVTCFFLAGRKVWWAWYIGLAGQFAWLAYSLITEQWGFLVGVALYTWVYSNNAWKWTAEHFYPMPANYEGLIPRPRGKERHVAARHAAHPGADNWVGRTLADELDRREVNAYPGGEFDKDIVKARIGAAYGFVSGDLRGSLDESKRDPEDVGPASES